MIAVVLTAAIAWALLSESDENSAGPPFVRVENVVPFETIRAAAQSGDIEAQYKLAGRYLSGHGVARDPQEAVEWYRKAAQRFHFGAQFALGALYEKGDGVRHDYLRAAEWYELAGGLGRNTDAAFALAQLYYHGRGVPQDPNAALKWYRLAAERGHAAAQYVVGYIYETGWGVEADRVEAYKWYTLATPRRPEALALNKQFDPEAARSDLATRMTRFDKSQAEQRANAWQPATDAPPDLRRTDGIATRMVMGRSLPAPVQPATASDLRRGLRLLSLDLPVAGDPKESITVNLIVELRDRGTSTMACDLVPRVRDAILQVLWADPVQRNGDTPDLTLAQARILEPINEGLGQAAAKGVFLYPGNAPLTPDEVLRTPFKDVSECHAAVEASRQPGQGLPIEPPRNF